MKMMFFGSLCGMAYQATLQQEIPLAKGVVLLVYFLLREEQSLDYGLGFLLGKHLLDLIISIENDMAAVNTPQF